MNRSLISAGINQEKSDYRLSKVFGWGVGGGRQEHQRGSRPTEQRLDVSPQEPSVFRQAAASADDAAALIQTPPGAASTQFNTTTADGGRGGE